MLSAAVDSGNKLTPSSIALQQQQQEQQQQPAATKAAPRGGSYVHAVTADMMWEWPADVSVDGAPLPEAVQRVHENQHPPKHVGSPAVSSRKIPQQQQQQQAGGTITAPPATSTLTPGGIVHYGFVPHGKRDVPEATQPCELPGSRNPPTPGVITVPPQKLVPERLNSTSNSTPTKSAKVITIEELGKQMESYAPFLPGAQKALDCGEQDDMEDTPPNLFCMELSALVTGPGPVEKPLEYLIIPGVEEKRPSIVSNISVGPSACCSTISVGPPACCSTISVGPSVCCPPSV